MGFVNAGPAASALAAFLTPTPREQVDDEDVQGPSPPSATSSSASRAPTDYFTLAFHRITGAELYYYDVELVRGTPRYFDARKKNQAIQEEKAKLINQAHPPTEFCDGVLPCLHRRFVCDSSKTTIMEYT